MRFKFTICLMLVMPVIYAGPSFQGSPASAQLATREQPARGEINPSLKRNFRKKGRPAGGREEGAVDADGEDVVRVESTLVACDVLVLDGHGRSVQGLTQADFVVTEDDQPQQVTVFALGSDALRPRMIVLIIDYSSSQLPYIETSVEAAKTLVDKLNPNDLMAVVTDDVSVLVDFTRDRAKLKEKLESLRKKAASGSRFGRSEQYSALMATLNNLSGGELFRPIVIFQTDGDELPTLRPAASHPPPPQVSYQPKSPKGFSIDDVYAAALKSRVTIYTVISGIRFNGFSPAERLERARSMIERHFSAVMELGFMSEKSLRTSLEKSLSDEQLRVTADVALWQQTALAEAAEVSGGWTEYLEKPGQASEIYLRILSDINRRYVIGYQPANREDDGRLRRVRVEVPGHPEYEVWGRKSYYMAGRK